MFSLSYIIILVSYMCDFASFEVDALPISSISDTSTPFASSKVH